jgi:hypothetical protein
MLVGQFYNIMRQDMVEFGVPLSINLLMLCRF